MRSRHPFVPRLSRVIAMMRLIEDHPGEYSRADLCQLFHISPRSADKDIQCLRQAGVDVRRTWDAEGHPAGYRIEGSRPYGG
jgi:predicted DNA-binding transcriptional regulator YafY